MVFLPFFAVLHYDLLSAVHFYGLLLPCGLRFLSCNPSHVI